jgi:hypothetical protein
MSSDSRQQVWDVFAKAMELYDKKNEDYGDAWQRDGWRGNLPRLLQKAERVRNLLWRADPRTPAVGDEQAVETLLDMLNSIAFTVINLVEEREWGGETPRSQRVSALEKNYTPGEGITFFQEVADELPHRQEFSHGHDEAVRTEVISQEHLRAAVEGVDPQALVGAEVRVTMNVGSDEMRPAEEKGSGHVARKPRQRTVTDGPQA